MFDTLPAFPGRLVTPLGSFGGIRRSGPHSIPDCFVAGAQMGRGGARELGAGAAEPPPTPVIRDLQASPRLGHASAKVD